MSLPVFRNDEVVLERLIGDGDGEARSASRRNRSRPPGVLKRASCGDLGGQLSFAFALRSSVPLLLVREITYIVTW